MFSKDISLYYGMQKYIFTSAKWDIIQWKFLNFWNCWNTITLFEINKLCFCVGDEAKLYFLIG